MPNHRIRRAHPLPLPAHQAPRQGLTLNAVAPALSFQQHTTAGCTASRPLPKRPAQPLQAHLVLPSKSAARQAAYKAEAFLKRDWEDGAVRLQMVNLRGKGWVSVLLLVQRVWKERANSRLQIISCKGSSVRTSCGFYLNGCLNDTIKPEHEQNKHSQRLRHRASHREASLAAARGRSDSGELRHGRAADQRVRWCRGAGRLGRLYRAFSSLREPHHCQRCRPGRRTT